MLARSLVILAAGWALVVSHRTHFPGSAPLSSRWSDEQCSERSERGEAPAIVRHLKTSTGDHQVSPDESMAAPFTRSSLLLAAT